MYSAVGGGTGSSFAFSGFKSVSEGIHYATLDAGVNTGTGSFAAVYPGSPTTAAGTILEVAIDG